jgi:hypothetical protein
MTELRGMRGIGGMFQRTRAKMQSFRRTVRLLVTPVKHASYPPHPPQNAIVTVVLDPPGDLLLFAISTAHRRSGQALGDVWVGRKIGGIACDRELRVGTQPR